MSGHTHRVQQHSKTDYTGVKAWYSIGHLADIKKAEYIENPDWQQAIGVVYFSRGKKRFNAQVIPIVDHCFIFNGRRYSPQGVEKL